MLVEPEYLSHALQEVARTGVAESLAALGQTEPALATFLHESLSAVAGKLALAGAPTPVVQGSHADVLAVVLTCVQALRRGHYALWEDTVTGTRLAQLDPSFRPKPRRRRKKSEGGGAEQGSN
jgi:hypothetical protein